jgi:hypothetical protein
VDAGPPPEDAWAVPELDLRSGPVLSERFTYPVCGPALAWPAPDDADGGLALELGPPGGCAGAVVTAAMHPAMLEVLSQRSGLLEARAGWLPTGRVPFVTALVAELRTGALRTPLPMVNPRVVFRSAAGTDLLLLDDDGACAGEGLAVEPGSADGGGLNLGSRGLPTGRLLRVRLPEGVREVRVEGGWRRACGE